MVDKFLELNPDFIKKHNDIIEPCCGKGAFIIALYNKFK